VLRHTVPAVISVLVLTALCCFVFPLVITLIAQVAFHEQANGSLIVEEGRVIGSELISQNFTAPGYFHPRPSAAGAGYDAANSGATNLASTSDKLINGIHCKLPNGDDDPANFDGITDLAKAYRAENSLPSDALVPADAVTRSASGLDPHISPANVRIQAVRVAQARGVPEDDVLMLVAKHTEGRFLGLLGEPRINVLLLNLELDKVYGAPRP
jgi:K+-transporting ATPase ATPase C chain